MSGLIDVFNGERAWVLPNLNKDLGFSDSRDVNIN